MRKKILNVRCLRAIENDFKFALLFVCFWFESTYSIHSYKMSFVLPNKLLKKSFKSIFTCGFFHAFAHNSFFDQPLNENRRKNYFFPNEYEKWFEREMLIFFHAPHTHWIGTNPNISSIVSFFVRRTHCRLSNLYFTQAELPGTHFSVMHYKRTVESFFLLFFIILP